MLDPFLYEHLDSLFEEHSDEHLDEGLSQIAHARVYGSYAPVRARIFTKINALINSYLMRKSLKFRKDPSFR